MSDVVVYESGELELKVSVDSDTIWLTQKQIVSLFESSKANISEHIKSIYSDNELDKISTVRKFRTVQKEGNREVSREVEHYNLDMIISIGYRVNSKKATKFRQWATSVLKEYIANGYAINSEKMTQQRLSILESDVNRIKSHIKNNTLELKQGVFYNGQIFDAYAFVVDIIKSATKTITLIDNYIDETTLTMLSKNKTANITVVSYTFSKELKLDIEKYNKQYKALRTITNKSFHDRYLIIDSNRVYAVGASLKDVGNKTFNVNLMSDFCEDDILGGR
ncbi:MAG: DNA-binding protein [Sulfurovum sp. FS08-3]|nr:MAG: DNA-binding protein [Sulfurovum sp. FS08-3]